MNLLNKLLHLVQFDLDAYFLFRTDLSSNAGPSLHNGPGELVCEVLDSHLVDQSKIAALARLMLTAGLAGKDEQGARAVVEDRLRTGDACATAWDNGRCIGLAWVAGAQSSVYKRFAECAARIPGAVVLYQAYVDVAYRGRRVHVELDRVRKSYLRSLDVRETLTFVGVKNLASVRNSIRTNDQYKLVYHLAVKGPRGIASNFYPKWSQEPWTVCGGQ